jgi:hypothetical protein
MESIGRKIEMLTNAAIVAVAVLLSAVLLKSYLSLPGRLRKSRPLSCRRN